MINTRTENLYPTDTHTNKMTIYYNFSSACAEGSVADLEILGGGSSTRIAREKIEATPTMHLATPVSRSLLGVFVFLLRCGDDFRS